MTSVKASKAVRTSWSDAAPVPYWLDTADRPPAHPALDGDLHTDLAVVGGGFTGLWTALMAKERGDVPLVHQVLFYPVTDANFDNGSYNEFADGPWLTKEAMKWFWNAYLPDEAKRKEPTASPLQASLEQLNGLPSALVIVDENDVLRDESEAYARKLSQAGVKVTSMRYNGTIHDFVLLNAIAETPAARSAITVANDTLRSALHK
jgi:acetyl esterase